MGEETGIHGFMQRCKPFGPFRKPASGGFVVWAFGRWAFLFLKWVLDNRVIGFKMIKDKQHKVRYDTIKNNSKSNHNEIDNN